MVPAVVKPQINMTAATPSLTTFGVLMQTLDIIPVLYGGVRSSSRVCAGVCEGVSIVSCNETCRIDIRSIDD